jgi:hypothetical protein
MIEETPEPIYKMAPVLYLLKPELAPQRMCYVPAGEGSYEGGLISINFNKISAVETPLFTHRMGELSTGLPVRPEQVPALYLKTRSRIFRRSKRKVPSACLIVRIP